MNSYILSFLLTIIAALPGFVLMTKMLYGEDVKFRIQVRLWKRSLKRERQKELRSQRDYVRNLQELPPIGQ